MGSAFARRVSAVVRAFNTVFAQVLAQLPDRNAARVPVFYAGDDESAKSSVRSRLESLGFAAVDAGPLRNARVLEPMGVLNIYLGSRSRGIAIIPVEHPRSGRLRFVATLGMTA